jgi:hypothetical protein
MTGSMASVWNGRMAVCYRFIGLRAPIYSSGRGMPIERDLRREDPQPWVNRYCRIYTSAPAA